MQIEIIPMKAHPCRLLAFTINGMEANVYDFGDCDTYGDEYVYKCSNIFTPCEMYDHNILEKYGISKSEYREICKKLQEKLHITNCGWCSGN